MMRLSWVDLYGMAHTYMAFCETSWKKYRYHESIFNFFPEQMWFGLLFPELFIYATVLRFPAIPQLYNTSVIM